MNQRLLKEWVIPNVGNEERAGINKNNLRMIGRVVPAFIIFTAVLLVIYAGLFISAPKRRRLDLYSLLVCFLLFLIVFFLHKRLERDPISSSKKGAEGMMELSYWAFSIWGICVSWRMYLNGNQMLIMDTVQIVFAFLICSYPLWGVIRVVTSYVILFLILFRTDGAAQINLAIYSLMAGMLCFGTVLRYGMELRNLEQMHALASHARAMENRSTHDELTGMKNRMALREDFPGYCHETLCVIMADVDHFKRYNDTYGHEVGDQILIAVASEITNLFGEDSTYRYGGDEFLIIQKDYTRSEISTLLMVWADAVRNIRLDIIPEEGDFSCSYGFTYGRPSGEEELRQMVVRADRKLYEMKRSPSRVSHSALAASRPGQI